MTLHPTVPHMPGETPASYASRLARRNGISSTAVFCGDFEIDLLGLFNGQPASLGRLADLAGTSVETLERDAWRRGKGAVESTTFQLRGHAMTRGSFRREGRRICAACMREDIASSDLPRGAAAHYRVTWQVSHLRTCPVHDLALAELPAGTNSAAQRDLAGFLDPYLDRLDVLADAQVRRAPSSLESYLLNRLEGRTEAAIALDALPFYAAAKQAEMLGAASMSGGRLRLGLMDDADWQRAGQIGFEIMEAGENGLQRFLTDLRTSRKKEARGSNQTSGHFGYLYAWLAQTSDDSAYDPLRDAIRRNVVENTAVQRAAVLFNQPLYGRKLHSIRSASVETGLIGPRLRRILAHTGHIPPDHARRRDHDVLFDAAATKELLTRYTNPLTLGELAEVLGTNKVQTRIIVKAGHIRPLLDAPESEVGNPYYAREDAERFLATLRDGAQLVTRAPPGAHPIRVVAKKTLGSSMDIVAMILERRLGWVGQIDAEGYSGLLVRLEEVRNLIRGAEIEGYAPRQAARLLKVPDNAIYDLIETGLVRTTLQRHPVARREVRIVTFKEIERFRLAYVSLFEASRTHGLHHMNLKSRLTAAGVLPVYDPKECGVTLYLRERVEALLGGRPG